MKNLLKKWEFWFISPVVGFFLFAGACSAYDHAVGWYQDEALKQSVIAAHATQAACEANYQARLQYKLQNHIALDGSGDPCPLSNLN